MSSWAMRAFSADCGAEVLQVATRQRMAAGEREIHIAQKIELVHGV